MYDMDRREYEEHYGEHVGTCPIHGTVIAGCEVCDYENIDYADWRSQCCDAPPYYVEGAVDLDYGTLPTPSGFCRHCKDTTLFEDARYD